MSYLMNGISALDGFLVDHTDPVGVLTKVKATLESNGKDTDEIDDAIELWTARKQPGQKGRKAVQIGESRSYSAQMIGEDGDVFVRLPVSLLGAVKGNKVSAKFEDGKIVVTLG